MSLEVTTPLLPSSHPARPYSPGASLYSISEDDQHAAREEDTETLHAMPMDATPMLGDRHWLYQRIRYYIPSCQWLPTYQWHRDFIHDLIAGLSVACLLVPQSLSYAAALAHIDARAGLYTGFAPALVYAIFGSSRHLSVGPEALVSILTGSAVAQLPVPSGSTPAEQLALRTAYASCMAFVVGLISLAMGLGRLGCLESMLSRALLCGFVTGVAVVVSIEQLPALLGLPPESALPISDEENIHAPLMALLNTLSRLHETNIYTALLSGATVLLLLLSRYLKKQKGAPAAVRALPDTILVVFLSSLLVYVLRLDERGVAVLGYVPPQIQGPQWPAVWSWRVAKQLGGTATLIAVLGFVESVVAAQRVHDQVEESAAASMTDRSQHKSSPMNISANREFIAYGLMNLLGACWGAYPAFGSFSRTLVASQSGARTPLAGIVTALCLCFTLAYALPLFAYLPKGVMAAVILVAVSNLIEARDVRFIIGIHAWRDGFMLAVTFAMTLLVSIEAGTLLAIALSLVLVVQHSTRVRFTLLGWVAETDPPQYRPLSEWPNARAPSDTLVARLDAPLYFANCGQLRARLLRAERYRDQVTHPSVIPAQQHADLRRVVLDVESVSHMDATAIQTLMDVCDAYMARGIDVCFVKLRDKNKRLFVRSGLLQRVGSDHFFRRIEDAVAYRREWEGNRNGRQSANFAPVVAQSHSTYDDIN